MELWTNGHSFVNLGMASVFQLDRSIVWIKQRCEEHKGAANKEQKKLLQRRLISLDTSESLRPNVNAPERRSDVHLGSCVRAGGHAHLNKSPVITTPHVWQRTSSWSCLGFLTLRNRRRQQNVDAGAEPVPPVPPVRPSVHHGSPWSCAITELGIVSSNLSSHVCRVAGMLGPVLWLLSLVPTPLSRLQTFFSLHLCFFSQVASFCDISCQTNNTQRATVRFTQEDEQTFITGFGCLLWTIGGWIHFFGTWCPFFCNYALLFFFFKSANSYKLTF